MPKKRSISIIFTKHAEQRMAERKFTHEAVHLVVDYGEEEVLGDGCKRYTLTNDVLSELFNDPIFLYYRWKKVILTGDNVVKTVINNDREGPDFETYTKWVE
jgi:hypothetical protein